MTKDELGRWGEDLAARHLEDTGLVVIARNWRCREGELDIVAADTDGRLVICEVKTRSGTGYGLPAEAVTAGKRRKLRRLAQLFAGEYGRGWMSFRFDVVSVLAPPGATPTITHLAEAF
ncbi:YraN family protein [Nakamurella sp. YIM 132087]|uniref:UPF0102 protein GIS00_22380 n=1 Tax=Nakamurella alba TaxID=2665158 RepID=A0A7K1FRB7_9ACTN|nr:YraN family protein [Nakamurella alba]